MRRIAATSAQVAIVLAMILILVVPAAGVAPWPPAVCEHSVTVTATTVSFFLSGPAWHMISLPCEPLDPDPAAVFDEFGGDLSGRLHRWDPCDPRYRTWYVFLPSDFGGPLRVGEGYWLWVDDDITITYEGYCDDGEHAIDFPCVGWYIIGHPRLEIVRLHDCEAELAGGRIPFCDAHPNWIGDPLAGYDPGAEAYYFVGCTFLFPHHELSPYQGYWADVHEAGLTVYVSAP